PSASRASTTVSRPAKRTSTESGSTSPDAWMRRRIASGVSLTDTASEVDPAPGPRSSEPALGSLALPVDVRRMSRRNAQATRDSYGECPGPEIRDYTRAYLRA